MSHNPEEEADLAPTQTEGYKVSQKQSLAHYANLEEEDESLNKWKASLGITAGSASTETNVRSHLVFMDSPPLIFTLVNLR